MHSSFASMDSHDVPFFTAFCMSILGAEYLIPGVQRVLVRNFSVWLFLHLGGEVTIVGCSLDLPSNTGGAVTTLSSAPLILCMVRSPLCILSPTEPTMSCLILSWISTGWFVRMRMSVNYTCRAEASTKPTFFLLSVLDEVHDNDSDAVEFYDSWGALVVTRLFHSPIYTSTNIWISLDQIIDVRNPLHDVDPTHFEQIYGCFSNYSLGYNRGHISLTGLSSVTNVSTR